MKTIGIWGFYFAENFGDDLMALQFAEIVKNLGAKPLVFDLSPILGARYNIDTTSEICDFCSRSEIILIGGGNLLAQDHTWPSGPFMKKTSELRMAAEHWNRPIHAFSIGGDGVDNPEYPYDVEQLLRSKTFKSATVRIKKDIIDMEKRGIKSLWIPDILWSAADFFKIKNKSINTNRDLRIGIHFMKNNPWIKAGLNDYLHCARNTRTSTTHIFINGFLHNSSSWDYIPDQVNHSDEILYCGDPIQVLNKIASVDCIVSQKLHMGLVGLSMRKPFLSFLAHPKVRAELNQFKWNWYLQYTGFKTRRFFGAHWVKKSLLHELKVENVHKKIFQANNTELPLGLVEQYAGQIKDVIK